MTESVLHASDNGAVMGEDIFDITIHNDHTGEVLGPNTRRSKLSSDTGLFTIALIWRWLELFLPPASTASMVDLCLLRVFQERLRTS